MPETLEYARCCTEITEQARQFRAALEEAHDDLGTVRVPSCPDWSLRELTVHLGGAHRWMAQIVRTRSQRHVPEEDVPEMHGPDERAGNKALLDWFTEGARLLADELLSAGADTPVWNWSGSNATTSFWARRATHETVIHRADACLATEVPFEVERDVAADCLDEWLEIVTSPAVRQHDADLRTLAERAGDTLHLHATDAAPGEDTDGAEAVPTEWLIRLGTDGLTWEHAHEKATVALRGPLTDILLVFYRRQSPRARKTEVLGDASLLDFWLERVSFG